MPLNLKKYAAGLANIVATCLESQKLSSEERVEVWLHLLKEISPLALSDEDAYNWAAKTKFPIGPFKDMLVIDAHPGYIRAHRITCGDEFWSMLVRYSHSSFFKEVHGKEKT